MKSSRGHQEGSSERRDAVELLSGVAAALVGLATPSAVRILGLTAIEAADPLLMSPLYGVSTKDNRGIVLSACRG